MESHQSHQLWILVHNLQLSGLHDQLLTSANAAHIYIREY